MLRWELRDRGDRIRTFGEGRDRSRPAGWSRSRRRAPLAPASTVRSASPATEPNPLRCDHELVGAPRPGVAADALDLPVRVDRVHHAAAGSRLPERPVAADQPVAEAADR